MKPLLEKDEVEKNETTGLEQELNTKKIGGELAVPEIVPLLRQMAAEGIVLLKNERGTLPLRKDDTVAVFGRTAVNYFVVGYGSGGDVIAPYKTNLMDGLTDKGVKVDQELSSLYADWCNNPSNIPDEGTWGNWPMSFPEMPLTEEVVKASAQKSDIALVVVGRAAGEDRENILKAGSYYLTDVELDMVEKVTRLFQRVCVIMDCGNVVDMSWTKQFDDKIGAIVYAWQGGIESGTALADVLTGSVSPSGKLTDTIAVSYEDYPSSPYFGDLWANAYVEDIYVGYRYFETFHPEKVLYPFGFGLSYTSFDLQSEGSISGNMVTLQVTVSNTGSFEGKEVVQVYGCFPNGKLGNPKKVLIGFAKTRTLKPGETQALTFNINIENFAPYDDSGVTGHKSCHVLESGTYLIEIGTNVRETTMVLTFDKTSLEVVRQLSEVLAVRPEAKFQRMINKDGAIQLVDVPTATTDLKQRILDRLPKELPRSGERGITFEDVRKGKNTIEEFVAQLSLEELDDISHGEGEMNSPLGVEGNAGAFGGVTESLRKRGIPPIITTDGPSGIRIQKTCSILPCGTALASSFNPEGVKELYSLLAKEMKHFGSNVLLGPGINIHRNPLCGRNFEYYSEDPLLTGIIGSATVIGLQSEGVSACPKHFACNNQEKNRYRNDSQVSERALREIYLKGFEIVVKETSPHTLMMSYNLINGVYAHYSYELATTILRDEWGYDGVVVTDWWMREGVSPEFPNISNDAYRVRAQVDVLMPGGDGAGEGAKVGRTLVESLKDPNGTTLAEAQRTACNVLRYILRTQS